MPTCPKGHLSTEPDYCSECGARIASPAPAPQPATQLACPDCGTPHDDPTIVFCEICGYNFTTQTHGDLSAIPPQHPGAPSFPASPERVGSGSTQNSPKEETQPPQQSAAESKDLLATTPETVPSPQPSWLATLTIDPTLREPASPEPPSNSTPEFFPLSSGPILIGRRSAARAVFPEIPIQNDDAVSHRHALLQLTAEGNLTLRDIGSSNGTRLNGNDLTPMRDYPLQPGDTITLGHWSRLTLTHP